LSSPNFQIALITKRSFPKNLSVREHEMRKAARRAFWLNCQSREPTTATANLQREGEDLPREERTKKSRLAASGVKVMPFHKFCKMRFLLTLSFDVPSELENKTTWIKRQRKTTGPQL